MKTTRLIRAALLGSLFTFTPAMIRAHCDTLDGPVVRTAQAALAKGEITPVLKWVGEADEAAVRAAFAQALEVRKLSPAAAALADRYFFETLVRLHRAGEGEPFTGLQPSGAADPALAAADHALEQGRAETLVKDLAARVEASLLAQARELAGLETHSHHSVAAGRAYVAAYVAFIHRYEIIASTAGPHGSKHAH